MEQELQWRVGYNHEPVAEWQDGLLEMRARVTPPSDLTRGPRMSVNALHAGVYLAFGEVYLERGANVCEEVADDNGKTHYAVENLGYLTENALALGAEVASRAREAAGRVADAVLAERSAAAEGILRGPTDEQRAELEAMATDSPGLEQ